jgi:outer membrane protein assembly complex protein YaeT
LFALQRPNPILPRLVLLLIGVLHLITPAAAQEDDGTGLPVATVRVVGNDRVTDTRILNTVQTQAGGRFDPETAREDIRRLFELRRFRRVDARYAVVQDGQAVEVVFEVEELAPAGDIRFVGNDSVRTRDLQRIVEQEAGFRTGERGDEVLQGLAADAIERFYRNRRFALVNVVPRRDPETGVVTFNITEGPQVSVVNIDFLGAPSFSERQLKRQIKTNIRWPGGMLGRSGTLDKTQLEADVASLQSFYRREKGYFDARIGRRLVWSPDLTEVQVEFLIDEGERYRIGEIRFEGVNDADVADLREAAEEVGLVEGEPYEASTIRAAQEAMVRQYVPLARVYSQPVPGIATDPDNLVINPIPDFRLEPGIIDLTFAVNEGKPFKLGKIRIRGNDKTQDKVILRQFDLAPGDDFDSEAVRQGRLRLMGTNYFQNVNVTPVAPPPGFDSGSAERDLLIEVEEQSTAIISFGGTVNSNGGVAGRIAYEQRNFDIGDWPDSPGDIFGDAFQGGGQTFRAVLEPGTIRTNASINFFEPRLLDRNLGLGLQGYYRTIRRREYRDTRAGGTVRFVPRLGRKLGLTFSLRGEDVRIFDLDDPISNRADEIVAGQGHTTLTSAGVRVSWADFDRPFTPTSGYSFDAGIEQFGVFGGPTFQRAGVGANVLFPLYVDARERPTVFELRGDAGAIFNDAPFFERFYGGGIGSIRGFRFRGVSPREGPADDPVGGDYSLTGSASVGFPLYDETLRGVLFTDFGSVDDDAELTTIRVSAGFGFRLAVPALGNVPLAFDFAWPINKRPEDDEQVFSFSLGILQ